jgi:hypothetical protein
VVGSTAILHAPGAKSIDEQTGLFWGYQPETPKLKVLHNKATGVIMPHFSALKDAPGAINAAAAELRGLCRLAVATLALLTTSTIVSTPTRPTGRFMSKSGTSKPYSERRIASLHIPHRIRDDEGYVRQQVKDASDRIRKRLHKVVGHFRHRKTPPINGTGWTPCYCVGREPGRYWHRHIESHWRGDETLGIVEREYTLVKGQKP